MELKDKTRRPVKKLLCTSPSKLLAKIRPNRFFAEEYPANTQAPMPNKARVLEIDFESARIAVEFLGDVGFTTAWKQSNAVDWIVRKNLFTRLKVVLITSES
jgi:hypothetical protein